MSSSLHFSFNLSSKSFTFLSILDLQDLFGRLSTEEMVKLKAFRPKLLYKSVHSWWKNFKNGENFDSTKNIAIHYFDQKSYNFDLKLYSVDLKSFVRFSQKMTFLFFVLIENVQNWVIFSFFMKTCFWNFPGWTKIFCSKLKIELLTINLIKNLVTKGFISIWRSYLYPDPKPYS